MVQGRKMGPLALVEHIAVEMQSIAPEMQAHDVREAKDLSLAQRTALALGAAAAPHCTPAQLQLWDYLHRTLARLVVENRDFEDPRHAEMFDFAAEVAV